MRYLVNSEEMRALDHYSIDKMGIPSMVLMERAAYSVVCEIRRRMGQGISVLILCGSGNNGADGLAMARMMSLDGDQVQVCVVGDPSHGTEEWKTQEKICQNMFIPIRYEREDFSFIRENAYQLIVDSLLGTGLAREVRGAYQACMEAVNTADAIVVAVDIPSGISADTGAVLGTAIRADLTVTFQYQKLGIALYPGADYAGECVVSDIGIVPQGIREIRPSAFTMEPDELSKLPTRPAWSNKGTFGRVLIVAGSKNMAGASILAGEAAYRTGSGLVRLFAPECNRTILQSTLPEAILTTYPELNDDMCGLSEIEDMLGDAIRWATSIVIGPGLGQSSLAKALVKHTLRNSDLPTVIDADALNILAGDKSLMSYLHKNCILTPHMGEMARLTGMSIAGIKADPLACVQKYSREWDCIVVQKDARSIVASPEYKASFVNICGNSGMSTGGSGDVLSGIIGGLLAGGVKPYQAANYGVLMHAHAGDQAAETLGQRALLARNLLEYIG